MLLGLVLLKLQLLPLLLLFLLVLPERVHATVPRVLHHVRQGILGTQVLMGTLLGHFLGGSSLLKDGPSFRVTTHLEIKSAHH